MAKVDYTFQTMVTHAVDLADLCLDCDNYHTAGHSEFGAIPVVPFTACAYNGCTREAQTKETLFTGLGEWISVPLCLADAPRFRAYRAAVLQTSDVFTT